jgi:hypothetical protein
MRATSLAVLAVPALVFGARAEPPEGERVPVAVARDRAEVMHPVRDE